MTLACPAPEIKHVLPLVFIYIDNARKPGVIVISGITGKGYIPVRQPEATIFWPLTLFPSSSSGGENAAIPITLPVPPRGSPPTPLLPGKTDRVCPVTGTAVQPFHGHFCRINGVCAGFSTCSPVTGFCRVRPVSRPLWPALWWSAMWSTGGYTSQASIGSQ